MRCVRTCVVRGQWLPTQTVEDVDNCDGSVQAGMVRHLGFFDVGAVAHSEDIGETFYLQMIVHLQSAVISQTSGCWEKQISK